MVLFYFIFVLLMIGYAALISYYHQGWSRIAEFGTAGKSEVDDGRQTSVSVIVALRNECHNVPALLDSLKDQDYPRTLTEIILVDDHSSDDTWALISSYAEDHFIKAFRLETFPGRTVSADTSAADTDADTSAADTSVAFTSIAYKKQAISLGIAQAGGELIVTTDADCTFERGWLTAITAYYRISGSVFIAAPVRYKMRERESARLLSVFESLDFITLQAITGASVSRKFHTMCNGANLAYTKAVFGEVDGFSGIDHIPGGDDMLLMYKVFKKYPDRVSYLKSQQAIVSTAGTGSWRSFFNQRIRWSSKAVHYDDKRVFWILLMVYLVNCCFLVAAFAAFFKTNYLVFFGLMLLAKVLIEFPFVNNAAMFFGQQRLMRYFPFMQPFHIVYTIIAGWLGKFGSYEWKGRKINNHGNSTQRT